MKPPEEPRAEWAYEAPPEDDLTRLVGANLRRLRVQRGLSLERLASMSGVSRAMLGQIELAQSTPTINVVWKITRALELPFSALMSAKKTTGVRVLPAAQAKRLTSADEAFSSRALFPFDEPRKVEFYELRLAPHGVENADAHSPGTFENLVVAAGVVEIVIQGARHLLSLGDAIVFQADVPHSYKNPGETEALLYLVMTYTEPVG